MAPDALARSSKPSPPGPFPASIRSPSAAISGCTAPPSPPASSRFRARPAGRVARRQAEVDGTWTFPTGFALTGRADRAISSPTAPPRSSTSRPAASCHRRDDRFPRRSCRSRRRCSPPAPSRPRAGPGLGAVLRQVGLGPEAFKLFPTACPRAAISPPRPTRWPVASRATSPPFLLSDALPMASRVLPRPDGRQRWRGD